MAEYKLRDQSTVFGLAWSFLHPLLLLTVLFLMFSTRLGEVVEHYAVYLLLGIVQYTHFAGTTSRAMRALWSMRKLTTDTIFPKEILVIGSVLANSIDLVASLGVCLVIAGVAGVPLRWTVLVLPAVVVLQVLVALAVGLLLASLFVFVRDVEHIYQVVLRILLFVTPIFYTRAFLGEGLGRWVVELNPLTHLIDLARTLVIDGRLFSPSFFVAYLFISLLLVQASLALFRRLEPRFAERV